MRANIIKDINKGEESYVFHINGQIHHLIGSLIPEQGQAPQYVELYIFDKNEIENRIKALDSLEHLYAPYHNVHDEMVDSKIPIF